MNDETTDRQRALFKRFLDSYFTTDGLRDGPDVHVLHDLDGPNKGKAEEMLIDSAGKRPVSWHLYALGELQSEAAVPVLTALAYSRTATDRIFAAHALYRINGFEDASRLILGILSKAHTLPRSSFDRRDAAWLLRDISSTEVITALRSTCNARDSALANTAMESLCRLLDISSPDGKVVKLPTGKVRCKTTEDTLEEIDAAMAARGIALPQEDSHG